MNLSAYRFDCVFQSLKYLIKSYREALGTIIKLIETQIIAIETHRSRAPVGELRRPPLAPFDLLQVAVAIVVHEGLGDAVALPLRQAMNPKI